MIRRKRIVAQYGDEPAVEVATFAFDGERLLAAYRNSEAQRMFVDDGIVARDGYLKPDDGAAFFDGLDTAFRGSSVLRVVAD